MKTTDWHVHIQPLLKKYKSTPHPLEYKNNFQLLVMVILSAQDSDRNINKLAPDFFKAIPNMEALARATADDLFPLISKVRNFGNKTKWLLELAQKVRTDKDIPLDMEALTALPGIGRKSANVIRREAGKEPEGLIVDLHVVRVAPRLGIGSGSDPKKIEKQMMEALPQKDWDAGMCISFLGREICRPTNPKCDVCVLCKVCNAFQSGEIRASLK